MRAVVQRVTEASVTVGGEVVGSIAAGICVLVGVTHSDGPAEAEKLAARLAKLRIFADEDAKMNLSVRDIGGQVLLISQFTLYADTRKGNRPGYSDAADPELARPLIDAVVAELRNEWGLHVETGVFGADMAVSIANQGPVTLTLDITA